MRQVILNFHGIGTPERPLEDGEAAYWVTPELFAQSVDLAARLCDNVTTTFTFDDGNASDIQIAAPLLARKRLQATFFPLSARIDQPGSLSANDLKALCRMGHSVGNHGADHTDWTALDESGDTREWTAARAAIATASGKPVTAAAIPFGRYNARVLRGLREAGYDRIYSSDGGAWQQGDWPIPRTSPTASMTIDDIENILLGREPLKARLRRCVSRALKARR